MCWRMSLRSPSTFFAGRMGVMRVHRGTVARGGLLGEQHLRVLLHRLRDVCKFEVDTRPHRVSPTARP